MRAPTVLAAAALALLILSACTAARIEPPDAGGDAGTDGGSAAVPAVGEVIFSEVMIDPAAVADSVGEWMELYNPSATVTYELRGCTVSDSNQSHLIGTSLHIAPGAYLTLARFASAADGGFTPDYTYGNDIQLVNAANTLSLECASSVVDTMAYTDAQAGVSGASLSLSASALTAVANDLTTNWCPAVDVYHTVTMIDDLGTPGMPNPACGP